MMDGAVCEKDSQLEEVRNIFKNSIGSCDDYRLGADGKIILKWIVM